MYASIAAAYGVTVDWEVEDEGCIDIDFDSPKGEKAWCWSFVAPGDGGPRDKSNPFACQFEVLDKSLHGSTIKEVIEVTGCSSYHRKTPKAIVCYNAYGDGYCKVSMKDELLVVEKVTDKSYTVPVNTEERFDLLKEDVKNLRKAVSRLETLVNESRAIEG